MTTLTFGSGHKFNGPDILHLLQVLPFPDWIEERRANPAIVKKPLDVLLVRKSFLRLLIDGLRPMAQKERIEEGEVITMWAG
jgi:hypothetical protein